MINIKIKYNKISNGISNGHIPTTPVIKPDIAIPLPPRFFKAMMLKMIAGTPKRDKIMRITITEKDVESSTPKNKSPDALNIPRIIPTIAREFTRFGSHSASGEEYGA